MKTNTHFDHTSVSSVQTKAVEKIKTHIFVKTNTHFDHTSVSSSYNEKLFRRKL
jgi:hypothetical protein